MLVETLTPHTFNSWTDGIKIVLDFYGVDFPQIKPDLKIAVNTHIEACDAIRRTYPASTYYVIGRSSYAEHLALAFSDRDIRLLLLPPVEVEHL